MEQHNPLKLIVKALLLGSATPLNINRLSEITGQLSTKIQEALYLLKDDLKNDDLLALKESNTGWSIVLKEDYVPWLHKLYEQKPQRLSKALLETLALIAYRQPITRTEIEVVRGVAVNANIIRHLLEQDWIKVIGHRDLPGRPELLATTKKFLDDFSLLSLKNLPLLDEPTVEKEVKENSTEDDV
jgi:segregation and condensation protein B